MTLDPAAPPAFGQANLSNCEREQIHFAGSIQPHGALLAVRESDGVIVQESGNAASFLGYAQPLRGAHLRKLGGDLWSRSRLYLDRPVDAIPVAEEAIGKLTLDTTGLRESPSKVTSQTDEEAPSYGVRRQILFCFPHP